MKRPLPFLLALSLLAFSPSAVFAEKTPAAAADPARSAAKGGLAGQYAGSWKGDAEGLGDLRITIRQADGKWVAESVFTFEGAEIPTKLKSLEADGAKVLLIFDWEIQGSAGQSRLTGELKDDQLQGKYETTGAAGNSTGTWSVKRQ